MLRVVFFTVLLFSFALFTLLPGPSGVAFAQVPQGRIIVPDTSVPPPPSIQPTSIPDACMEAQRLFYEQQALQPLFFSLLENIHHVVASSHIDDDNSKKIANQMGQLEKQAERLMQRLAECQQQARPEASISPCEQIPLLESAIRSAMEVNRDERLRQMAESRMGGYLYAPQQVQIRVPQPGTIINLGQFLPQNDIYNLPDPGVDPQDGQLQNLFRQLQQARMECLQSQSGSPVP